MRVIFTLLGLAMVAAPAEAGEWDPLGAGIYCPGHWSQGICYCPGGQMADALPGPDGNAVCHGGASPPPEPQWAPAQNWERHYCPDGSSYCTGDNVCYRNPDTLGQMCVSPGQMEELVKADIQRQKERSEAAAKAENERMNQFLADGKARADARAAEERDKKQAAHDKEVAAHRQQDGEAVNKIMDEVERRKATDATAQAKAEAKRAPEAKSSSELYKEATDNLPARTHKVQQGKMSGKDAMQATLKDVGKAVTKQDAEMNAKMKKDAGESASPPVDLEKLKNGAKNIYLDPPATTTTPSAKGPASIKVEEQPSPPYTGFGPQDNGKATPFVVP